MDFFWYFIILIAFFPYLQKKTLEYRRNYHRSRIEQERGTRLILLVHRQETLNLLGFPLMRYIDMNDSEQVLRFIHETDPDTPIDMVLHTPGGLVLASLQIARALRAHPGKVTVFVPHLAMSGGTLIALAADEVVTAPHAVLGPVDPQINQYPAASIGEVTRHKPLAEIDDETLILADVSEKAVRQIRLALEELLPDDMAEKRREDLADLLSRGAWTHDYPLDAQSLSEFGLNVSEEMPPDLYELMSLYPQPGQRQGGVEYSPLPPRGPDEKPGPSR